jgi:hypothetical protein
MGKEPLFEGAREGLLGLDGPETHELVGHGKRRCDGVVFKDRRTSTSPAMQTQRQQGIQSIFLFHTSAPV